MFFCVNPHVEPFWKQNGVLIGSTRIAGVSDSATIPVSRSNPPKFKIFAGDRDQIIVIGVKNYNKAGLIKTSANQWVNGKGWLLCVTCFFFLPLWMQQPCWHIANVSFIWYGHVHVVVQCLLGPSGRTNQYFYRLQMTSCNRKCVCYSGGGRYYFVQQLWSDQVWLVF